jgi:hypothetical protein
MREGRGVTLTEGHV